ncbi:MAG: LytTR family transcriptional regulator [Clostridia bacterium]|nr:LytTR family transcriptional regulator [Clostridia bacterium]
MKLRIEIDPERPEEIVIYAREITDDLRRIQSAVGSVLSKDGELALKNGDSEFYLPYAEVLFFETADNRVWAHTAKDCFSCPLHLHELEDLLPHAFARASKCCVVNTAKIKSLKRFPTGIAEAAFYGTEKRIYISRMYYKPVRTIIEETRLNQQ